MLAIKMTLIALAIGLPVAAGAGWAVRGWYYGNQMWGQVQDHEAEQTANDLADFKSAGKRIFEKARTDAHNNALISEAMRDAENDNRCGLPVSGIVRFNNIIQGVPVEPGPDRATANTAPP